MDRSGLDRQSRLYMRGVRVAPFPPKNGTRKLECNFPMHPRVRLLVDWWDRWFVTIPTLLSKQRVENQKLKDYAK